MVASFLRLLEGRHAKSMQTSIRENARGNAGARSGKDHAPFCGKSVVIYLSRAGENMHHCMLTLRQNKCAAMAKLRIRDCEFSSRRYV